MATPPPCARAAPARRPLRWWESLHARLSLLQALLLCAVVGLTVLIVYTVERAILVEQRFEVTTLLGRHVVSQLSERIALAESLATTIANVAESIPRDAALYHEVFPRLLDYEGESAFIAGGGIWPEPNTFDPAEARCSFFWGRNAEGALQFYGDYNNPESRGYHGEIWYVPARYLPPGRGIWSNAYLDTYSYQPMVTYTVPLYDAAKNNLGAATVDVKLDGIDEIFAKAAQTLGGYIFAVDRENRFISFPIKEWSTRYFTDEQGKITGDYFNMEDLAMQRPVYGRLQESLERMNQALISRAESTPLYAGGLPEELALRGYRLLHKTPRLLAAAITDPLHGAPAGGMEVQRHFWEDDPVLDAAVMATVFQMPDTYWKVIVVTPTAGLYAQAGAATRHVVVYVAALELIALFAMFVAIRYLYARPIHHMAGKMRGVANHAADLTLRLDDTAHDEIGMLAYEFNARTGRLAQALAELEDSNRSLSEETRAHAADLLEMKRLRALLGSILDAMPSALIGADAASRVTHWNRKAAEETGISPQHALGRPLREVYPAVAPLVDIIADAIEGQSAVRDIRLEDHSDPEPRLLHVSVYPIGAEGAPGAVVRIDDVTERVHLEEAMSQSEKMLSLGGLAAGMAHEINTPLAGILRNVQAIQSRIQPGLEQNARIARECGASMEAVESYVTRQGVPPMLNQIREAGHRAAEIVINMLSFSRKSTSHFTRRDLAKLLEKTVDLASNDYDLSQKYGFRQIEILREYPPGTPQVLCEATNIQQVFLNILKNGAEAMAGKRRACGNGPYTPQFRLRVLPAGSHVQVEIEDNGPGLDEDIRRRIFEPLFTTKGAGFGAGLGLSVSYFIITENHGGALSVRSQPGTGTTFCIRIPVEGPPAA
ncbi:MAG: PAS domain-containing protein [Candidatus Hydrogenedentes bacterium]|nr:PAS domain-containing protein [Candidatus Hydrogenedentota bacterium]